jgi:hypothetical protein
VFNTSIEFARFILLNFNLSLLTLQRWREERFKVLHNF